MSQKIIPNLWFDGQAEDAANYYVSVFESGRILNTTRYTQADPDASKAERAMQAMFSMKKLDIAALQAAADGAPSEAM
jgi:predicted 3-demethylubiquinone-9 3-methyltransferase (glyoxalase superfamily)